jgi:hypothetical protein
MLSMGDFSGTGGGIGDFFSGLKEGSIFRSAGPAPSEIRAGTAAGETPRNFPEVPLATPADFTAPTPAQLAAPASDGSQIPKFGEEGFQFAERGSPQDFFLSQTNDGTTALSQEQIDRGQAFADQRGMNFDPLTGFSQGTEAAPQQGLTTAGGQPLGEFLAGGQQLDAQGRMIDPNVDRSFFEQQSAEREARQAARPDFGEAVSDRERRAARGDGISDADRRDMAKANRPGASAGDVARGNKVAARAGVDLRTGQPLASEGGLTETERLNREKLEFTKAEAARKAGLTQEEAAAEVSEGRNRDFAAAEAMFSSNENIADVGQKAQRQAGESLTTGVFGAILAKLKPGSNAADMQANLDTLTADAAFSSLQTMRDNSKTGGALGAISERELTLLGASQRSLAASQSPEQLKTNIAAYLKLRTESMARVKAGFAKEYGQPAADRIFGGGQTSGGGAIPNDRDVAGASDALLSSGKY